MRGFALVLLLWIATIISTVLLFNHVSPESTLIGVGILLPILTVTSALILARALSREPSDEAGDAGIESRRNKTAVPTPENKEQKAARRKAFIEILIFASFAYSFWSLLDMHKNECPAYMRHAECMHRERLKPQFRLLPAPL